MHRKIGALTLITLAACIGAALAQDAEPLRADGPRGRGGFYRGTDPAELPALRSGVPPRGGQQPARWSGYYRDPSWYRDTDSQRRRYEPRYDDNDDVRVVRVHRSPSYRIGYYGYGPYYSRYPRDPHYYYHHFSARIGLGFYGSFCW